MDEDAKLIEAHMKVHELMAELLEDAPPSLVAGIFQACATKIYKTILTQEEFQNLMDTVSESANIEYNNETLH
tara:strand:- start:2494 stop:2712 length:219 start_codon:yes stop_codon:yes gene_type:complete